MVGVDCDGSGSWYQCPDSQLVVISNNNATVDFTLLALDVRNYSITKSVSFWQADAGSLVLNTNHGPFTATLGIIQSSPDSVPIATVTLPNGEVRGFPRVTSGMEMQVQERFTSQAEMEAHYGSGNYSFAMATRNNGFQFPVLAMPVAVYPTNPPPRVSNIAAAQAINPSGPFTLQWSNPSDATASDYVWVFIMDGTQNTIFSTPYPPTSSGTSLRGTNTWVEVPANTFQPGEGYTGVIVFLRMTGVNTSSYPGAFGLTSTAADTAFPMAALSGVPVLSEPTRTSSTQFSFVLSGILGTNYLILASTNVSLPLSEWFPVLTTNLTGSSALIQDNEATNQGRFYRAKVVP